MTCAHRTTGRWGKVWTTWLALTVGSFTIAETVALLTEGEQATLSLYLRRAAGLAPPCRHSHVGRALIFAALAWTAAHLAWGVLGIKVGPRTPSGPRP